MNNICKHLVSIGFVVLPFLFRCTSGEFSGIEVTNGNCLGKIYNDDNTAASNALVLLIPSGYDPTIPSSGKIDSTFTRADGSYSFFVTKSDFYTVFAQKNGKSCKKDSVSVLSDARQDVGNDTLAESAYLSGRIIMKPGSDPSTAVILFTGTNLYTSPKDSSGYFDTMYLPAGKYTLKAFTTEDGYSVFDTAIILSSGEHRNITITIPTSYAPQIQSISTIYDPSTFQATVVWQKVDTSKIMGYSIYRFINGRENSLILLDNYRGRYTDDLSNFYNDTIFYKVAAVGKNYMEGYFISASPFVVCVNANIDYNIAYNDQFNVRQLKVLGNDCIGLTYNSSIVKITSDGNVQELLSRERALKLSPYGISSIGVDSLNNIYAMCELNMNTRIPVNVYKLNNDLHVLDTLIVNDTTECNIVTGSDGSLYFEYHNSFPDSIDYTKIRVYDPTFNLKNEFVIHQNITLKRCSNNRVMAVGYQKGTSSNKFQTTYLVMVFDSLFNLISSSDAKEPFKSDLICNQILNGYSFDIISDNMYITEVRPEKYPYNIIILSDLQRNSFTKITVPPDFIYLNAASGKLFGSPEMSSRSFTKFSLRS